MQKVTPTKKILSGQVEPVYLTSAADATQADQATQPSWVRLPKAGQRCPYTGLSRSALNALVLGSNPPVKSVSLKKRYAVRGVRLIHLGSLLEYIEGMATAQETNRASSEADNLEQ